MLDSGFYSLQVSNNGLQFVTASLPLLILNAIQVLQVTPSLVLSSSLNQLLFVEATNLRRDVPMQCLFEIVNSKY